MTASVLTNSSAMVALQTLRATNSNLQEINNQISTGKKVATAKDNAAVFAITEIMNSDVVGFKAITESLSLGSATVAVASNAADQVANTLYKIKEKVVAAQESNVDRTALQNEIVSLSAQVQGIVDAAQFNGRNLVDGSTASINVLSSLDRNAAGVVTSSQITVTGQNLSTGAGAVRGGLAGSTGETTNQDDAAFTLDAGFTNDGSNVLTIDAGNFAAGDQITVTIDDQAASYTVTAADLATTTPNATIAGNLRDQILALNVDGLVVDYDSGTDDTLDFGNDGAGNVDRLVTASVTSVGTGGLAALAGIDVTANPANALTDIETLIRTTVTAQAAFGTAETRLDLQNDFMSSLIDSFKSGIGALVDADLEEASARLQSLQVQQQLGTQALSIANQQPQNLLALFR
ncbi:MAG: flagellin [Pseudomonadota bacterium]